MYRNVFQDRPRTLAVMGLLIALLAFGTSASNDFVQWDDSALLTTNAKMNPPTLRSVLSYALPRNAELQLYIPLTEFCWGGLSALAYVQDADQSGSHLNPWIFHSASIGLHLLNALLVFLCLQEMLFLLGHEQVLWPAWVGAMVFAVHPLQLQAVAWACGLKDLLSGTFVLGCVYSFFRFRAAESDEFTARPRMWYAFALLCCVLANLAKPGAVATPLAIFALDCLLLRTPIRKSVKAIWFWFVLVIPIILITRSVQEFGWTDIPRESIWLRPLVAGDALAFYIEKLFVPIRLSFDYQRTPDVVLNHWTGYVAWLVPTVILGLCLWSRQRRWLLAGLLFSIASLSPVLGIVPFGSQEFSTVADRYLYVPMLGVSLIVALLVIRFSGKWMTVVVFVVVILFAVLTEQASANWQDNEHLCQQAVAVNPDAWNALYGLALNRDHSGDAVDAEKYYLRSLRAYPRNERVIKNLAMLYIHQGRADDALEQMRSLTRYYQKQKNADADTAAKANLAIGMIMFKKKRYPEAIEACQISLSIEPNEPHAIQLLQASRAAASQPTTRPTTLPSNPIS